MSTQSPAPDARHSVGERSDKTRAGAPRVFNAAELEAQIRLEQLGKRIAVGVFFAGFAALVWLLTSLQLAAHERERDEYLRAMGTYQAAQQEPTTSPVSAPKQAHPQLRQAEQGRAGAGTGTGTGAAEIR